MAAQPEESAQEITQTEQREAPQGELHLRFSVPSGKEFAIPATGIREVVAQSPHLVTPVPNASYLLLGMMNLRGQVIWVADLGQFLGEAAVLTTDRLELPIIAIEDQETMIGLAVESVLGMDWLDLEQVKMPSEIPDSMAPFVRGEWDLEVNGDSNRSLKLLDPVAILHSARWAA